MPRLTIELVPGSCWFVNVRSSVPPAVWEVLKKQTAKAARWRCELCAGRGSKWPVECHEVWDYNDQTHTQTLIRLIALCPMCHKTKHIGLALTNGEFPEVRAHMMAVNQWSRVDTDAYIKHAFEMFEARSQFEWTLDISYLKQFGIMPEQFERPASPVAANLPKQVIPALDFDPFDHIVSTP